MPWPVASKTVGFLSIDAALTTGAGSAVSVAGSTKFGLQVVTAGTITTMIVVLQGTIDGTNWFTIGTWDKAAPLTSGDIVFVTDKPVSQVRANCTTFTTQAAGRTVSAYISAV